MPALVSAHCQATIICFIFNTCSYFQFVWMTPNVSSFLKKMHVPLRATTFARPAKLASSFHWGSRASDNISLFRLHGGAAALSVFVRVSCVFVCCQHVVLSALSGFSDDQAAPACCKESDAPIQAQALVPTKQCLMVGAWQEGWAGCLRSHTGGSDMAD